MKLYHFTSMWHARQIAAAGFIDTTESNVSWAHDHCAPDVVWLTTEAIPTLAHGLEGSIYDKTEVRMTVEVPKDWPKRWKKWAPTQGSTPRDMEILATTGGGWEAADTWFVCTRRIPLKYVTAIESKGDPDAGTA